MQPQWLICISRMKYISKDQFKGQLTRNAATQPCIQVFTNRYTTSESEYKVQQALQMTTKKLACVLADVMILCWLLFILSSKGGRSKRGLRK